MSQEVALNNEALDRKARKPGLLQFAGGLILFEYANKNLSHSVLAASLIGFGGLALILRGAFSSTENK
jgi:hypothetical protein